MLHTRKIRTHADYLLGSLFTNYGYFTVTVKAEDGWTDMGQ